MTMTYAELVENNAKLRKELADCQSLLEFYHWRICYNLVALEDIKKSIEDSMKSLLENTFGLPVEEEKTNEHP